MKKVTLIALFGFVLWVIVTAQILKEQKATFQETMQWIKDTMGKDEYSVGVGDRRVNSWKYVVSWTGCNVIITKNGNANRKNYSESDQFVLSDVSFEYETAKWIKPSHGSRYGVLTFKTITGDKKIIHTDSKVKQKDSVSFPFGGSEALVDRMVGAWKHAIALCCGPSGY
jgi:hypothetical protein